MIDYRGHMEKYLFIKNQIVMSGLLFGGFAPMLYAATEQTQQVVVLPTIQVIGSQEDSISKIPGAAVIVSQEQIQQFTPSSTEEILNAYQVCMLNLKRSLQLLPILVCEELVRLITKHLF